MVSLVSVIEIKTTLSGQHYVQVLLAICRGCFFEKLDTILRQKTARFKAENIHFD